MIGFDKCKGYEAGALVEVVVFALSRVVVVLRGAREMLVLRPLHKSA